MHNSISNQTGPAIVKTGMLHLHKAAAVFLFERRALRRSTMIVFCAYTFFSRSLYVYTFAQRHSFCPIKSPFVFCSFKYFKRHFVTSVVVSLRFCDIPRALHYTFTFSLLLLLSFANHIRRLHIYLLFWTIRSDSKWKNSTHKHRRTRVDIVVYCGNTYK